MSVKSYERDWKEQARFRETSKDLVDFWTVEMTADDDDATDIQAGIPFMRQYAKHPTIGGAFLIEFRSDRIEGLNTFRVELEYSTDITQQVNPLSIPPVITAGFVAREVPSLIDANGKAKVNAAGDLFDEATKIIYDRVYKVIKNQSTDLPDWCDDYINCVNSDEIRLKGRTWPAGTVLYVPGEIGQDSVGGPQQDVPFCEVAFELHCRRDGWTTLIPNRGFNEIVELPAKSPLLGTPLDAKAQAGIKTIPGQLPDDQVVGFKKGKRYVRRKIYIGQAKELPTEAQMLDKFGRAIPVPTIDNIVLLEFDDHDKKPFNGILPLK